MKRRAILEMVCKFRKNRDFWRKLEKEGASAITYEKNCENLCYLEQNYADARMYAWRCVGMVHIVQERKGRADGFHISAHCCMELLER